MRPKGVWIPRCWFCGRTPEMSEEHYDRVPTTYHKAWFYEKNSPYELWQLDLVCSGFSPIKDTATARLADVGGGTGHFTQLVHSKLGLQVPSLCVDFSPAMLKQADGLDGIEALCLDGVSYAKQVKDSSIDRCLLKEVVHHIPEPELPELFGGLARGLREDGVCLIVTRPKVDIDYPFPEKAVEVWKAHQPDASIFAKSMEENGFKNVTVELKGFPVEIKLDDWTAMIKDRMWSTFAEEHFTPEELTKGIEEIEANYPVDESGIVRFEERIVLVRGERA